MSLYILSKDPDGNCCECRDNPCDSCGEPPASCDCYLSLPVDTFQQSYSTLAEAKSIISDYTDDCVAYNALDLFNRGGITYPFISFSSSYDSDSIEIQSTNGRALRGTVPANYYGSSVGAYVSVTIPDGCQITVECDFADSADLGGNTLIAEISRTCPPDGNQARGLLSNISSPATINIFTDGEGHPLLAGTYNLKAFYAGYNTFTPGGSVSATFTITFSTPVVFNPIRAASLEGSVYACPKMLIPPDTEISHDWYTNQTEAQSEINNNVYDCKTYILPDLNELAIICNTPNTPEGIIGDYSVSVGPSSVSITSTSVLLFIGEDECETYAAGFDCYFTVLGIPGSTVTINISESNTILGNAHYIFNFVDQGESCNIWYSGSGSTMVTATVPYDGKCRMRFQIINAARFCGDYTPYNMTVLFNISSPDDFEILPVQALYDVGLDCPARLDC